jgi:hypothetical protein
MVFDTGKTYKHRILFSVFDETAQFSRNCRRDGPIQSDRHCCYAISTLASNTLLAVYETELETVQHISEIVANRWLLDLFDCSTRMGKGYSLLRLGTLHYLSSFSVAFKT